MVILVVLQSNTDQALGAKRLIDSETYIICHSFRLINHSYDSAYNKMTLCVPFVGNSSLGAVHKTVRTKSRKIDPSSCLVLDQSRPPLSVRTDNKFFKKSEMFCT